MVVVGKKKRPEEEFKLRRVSVHGHRLQWLQETCVISLWLNFTFLCVCVLSSQTRRRVWPVICLAGSMTSLVHRWTEGVKEEVELEPYHLHICDSVFLYTLAAPGRFSDLKMRNLTEIQFTDMIWVSGVCGCSWAILMRQNHMTNIDIVYFKLLACTVLLYMYLNFCVCLSDILVSSALPRFL